MCYSAATITKIRGNMLTIYARADNSNLTEAVYTSTSAKKLYIKLTDSTNKTLVHTPVTSVKQAIAALKNYSVNAVHVSYNVDCTQKISSLANSINKKFLN